MTSSVRWLLHADWTRITRPSPQYPNIEMLFFGCLKDGILPSSVLDRRVYSKHDGSTLIPPSSMSMTIYDYSLSSTKWTA